MSATFDPALFAAAAMGMLCLWRALKRRPVAPVDKASEPDARLAAERARLLRDLPGALTSGEVHLAYQPKLNLRGGHIASVEALVRWDHPELGSIARTVLIPLTENGGLMRDLTLWVLRRAIVDQGRLFDAGTPVVVFVNIAGNLLGDELFVDEVCALAPAADGRIGLEITETSIIDHPATGIANLQRIVAHGVAVSIDDYGTGLSSLAYLKDLPATELKIDKLFVSGMTTSRRDPLIVRSTIDLAHALEMSVVAEGVESMATLALLRVMGCDSAQGFLISPALRLDDLIVFIEQGRYRALLDAADATLKPPQAFWRRSSREPAPEPPAATTAG